MKSAALRRDLNTCGPCFALLFSLLRDQTTVIASHMPPHTNVLQLLVSAWYFGLYHGNMATIVLMLRYGPRRDGRSNAERSGSLSNGSSTEDKPPSKAQFLAWSIGKLALGTIVCAIASDPMVDAVSNFSAVSFEMPSARVLVPAHAPNGYLGLAVREPEAAMHEIRMSNVFDGMRLKASKPCINEKKGQLCRTLLLARQSFAPASY